MLTAWGLCFGVEERAGKHPLSTYEDWEAIGKFAAETSLSMISKAAATPQKKNLVVLTNAGFVEVEASPTQGALDGLTEVAGVSRGRNTLVEIHSASWGTPWFALFDKGSGFCAYLEVDPLEAAKMAKDQATIPLGLFSVRVTERIDAEYLYQHAAECKDKFDSMIFGGNEFRIITIANAIAAGAPTDAVRVFEFHDHYCPGVTSGILMARYLKVHFPPGKSGYFVHAVEPWCKEDAFLVLLNATPGKRSYAVSYPTEADRARKVPEAKNASTIVYRQNGQTKRWEGLVLGFEWAETSCPKTGNGIVEKLCADLWYLERMEKPENFIKVIKRFKLPDGISPVEWARPGIDPLRMLGLVKNE
jgi:formylmethanofuran dehydrogenase subunit E-like metal-binding protein